MCVVLLGAIRRVSQDYVSLTEIFSAAPCLPIIRASELARYSEQENGIAAVVSQKKRNLYVQFILSIETVNGDVK